MAMAVDQTAKAKQYLTEADQKLNVTSGGCCKSKRKMEEASELYVKAANAFKMAKDWNAAGHAFAEAAALQLKNNRLHEAGNYYTEAAKCYRKVSAQECAKCELEAAEVYTNMGRPRVAAKHHQAYAEVMETPGEAEDLKRSVEHYLLAAELYGGEDSGSPGTKCWLKVAKHSATLGDYGKAAEIYERISKDALNSALLKYTANDLFLRAGLCRLQEAGIKALEHPSSNLNPGHVALEIFSRYEDESPAFSDCREKILLEGLARAVAENDLDAFNEAIRSHESISRLEPWYHDLLRSIRKYVGGTPDLR